MWQTWRCHTTGPPSSSELLPNVLHTVLVDLEPILDSAMFPRTQKACLHLVRVVFQILLLLSICLFGLGFWDRVFLVCSPDYPGTYFVTRAGLELIEIPCLWPLSARIKGIHRRILFWKNCLRFTRFCLMCMSVCLRVSMCTTCVPGAHRGQKRALKVQGVVSHHVAAGIQ